MHGGRVAVVGGSIAGCAAALAAARAGADEVVVFERAAGELHDRGVGLGVHNERYAELAAAGFVDDGMPWVQLDERRWFANNGGSPLGGQVAVQPFPFRGYNWGSLWRGLRSRVPASVDYRADSAVAEVKDGTDEAVVHLADGAEERFDLVIGADGYRSAVRTAMFPEAIPEYSGYLGWRGTFPASRLARLDGLTGPDGFWGLSQAVTIGISGGSGRGSGHLMSYRIPGGDGGDIVNWIMYATPPVGVDLGLESPTSLPPGRVTTELVDHLYFLIDKGLPPYWAAAIWLTDPEKVFVQPIYDLEVPSYVGSRLLLLGDAATVARPHSGAGAVKALQDAAVLESAWKSAATWEELLNQYDAQRRPIGRTMVATGRRVGRAQVTDAPDWGSYDQAGFDAWWHELTTAPDGVDTLGGRTLRQA